MSKFSYIKSTLVVCCIIFIGGLYEIFFSGNFSSYSTSGMVKSIVLMALIAFIIILYFFRNKDNEEDI